MRRNLTDPLWIGDTHSDLLYGLVGQGKFAHDLPARRFHWNDDDIVQILPGHRLPALLKYATDTERSTVHSQSAIYGRPRAKQLPCSGCPEARHSTRTSQLLWRQGASLSDFIAQNRQSLLVDSDPTGDRGNRTAGCFCSAAQEPTCGHYPGHGLNRADILVSKLVQASQRQQGIAITAQGSGVHIKPVCAEFRDATSDLNASSLCYRCHHHNGCNSGSNPKRGQ
ncbi:hypothetical protein SRABI102_02468 [Stenotrophomonas lactitubi]|nr:hypothetical protein SRABI122_02193 [Stenotrophomonas lactitubi]CAH0228742.1 hypothetical protein SRABI102_02468 [Stenotrophomonas lactitubi]CAH0242959.1 hypothetical protein SRABI81_02992 [Stenotrophomonas lactitubi]